MTTELFVYFLEFENWYFAIWVLFIIHTSLWSTYGLSLGG